MLDALRTPAAWTTRATRLGAAADRRLRPASMGTAVAVAAMLALGQLAPALIFTSAFAVVALMACAFRGERAPDRSQEVDRLRATATDLRFSNALLREALERARQRLRQEDLAAGLLNRQQFEAEWARCVSRFERRGELFALVVAKLEADAVDGEDPAAVEAALRHLGESLVLLTRAEDTVAQVDGQTFGVLLAATREEGGERFADRLHYALPGRPAVHGDRPLFPGVALGYAAWEHGMQSFAELLSAAEAACEQTAAELRRQRNFFLPDPVDVRPSFFNRQVSRGSGSHVSGGRLRPQRGAK